MRSVLGPIAVAAFLAGCANGLMLNAGPARSDDVFAQIQVGMTTDEVLQRLGRPDESMPFPLSQTDSWGYQYYDTWGYLAIFSVTFGPDHRIVSKFSRRVNVGGDGRP
jgi:outer membrane protein assembly factor BamE (lipoprotein component of BamABCDE complex)